MNQEKRQRQQEQILRRRGEIIAGHPELGKFVEAKDKWIRILLLAGFVVQIAQSVAMGWITGDASIGMFFFRLLGYWKYLFILILCRGSMKKIKMAGIMFFCLIALTVMKFGQQRTALGTDFSTLMFYREMLKMAPGIVITDVLAKIYDLAIAVTIVCLLAVPKNRKRIERFDNLMSGVGSMSEIAKRTVD